MAARRNRYTSFCAFIHLSAALRSSRLQDFGTQTPPTKAATVGLIEVDAFAAGLDDHRIADQGGGVSKLAIMTTSRYSKLRLTRLGAD
jgi:hypothetical protein